MTKENENKGEVTKRRLRALVAIDGSPIGDLVVKRVAQYIQMSPFDIALLHVIPETTANCDLLQCDAATVPTAPPNTSGYLYEKYKYFTEKKEEANQVLSKAANTLKDFGIESETKIAVGPVTEEIVRSAEEGKFDIIIMGSKGFGGVKKLLLGGVAEQVIRRASCSVTIIR